MTNPSSSVKHHYNQISWGPLHFFVSQATGRRLAFRANDFKSVRPDFLTSGAIVESVGGCEFAVTSTRPEAIR